MWLIVLSHGGVPEVPLDLTGAIVTVGLMLLCAWAVYTDLSHHVVTNANVLALFGLGVVVQVQLVLGGHKTWQGAVALAAIAGAIAIALYLLHFWAPGDGKLFWALCLATPVEMPETGFVNLPVQLLTWTLLVTLLFVVVIGMRAALRQVPGKWNELRFDRRTVGKIVRLSVTGLLTGTYQMLIFAGIGALIGYWVPYRLGPLKPLGLAVLLNLALDRIGSRWRHLLLVPLAVGGLYFMARLPVPLLLVTALAFPLVPVAGWFINTIDRTFSERLKLKDVRRGYYLADTIVEDAAGQVIILSHRESPGNSGETVQRILGPDDGALTPDGIALIRKLLADGRLSPDQTIAVRWSIPFAPFISFGTLVFLGLVLVGRM